MDQLISHVRGFSFGKMTYPKGGLFGPIMRPYLSVVVIDEGSCTMRSDLGSVTVGADQTGIIVGRSGIEFAYPKDQSTTVAWCEGFLPDLPAAQFEDRLDQLPPHPATDGLKRLQEIGVGTGHGSSVDLNSLRDAIGLAVCRAFLLDARHNARETRLPKRILAARRYMEDRIADEALSVTAVANHVGMSPQHLIASFKSALGMSPGRFLWQMRSARARQLLVHTRMSQSEIAYGCGYKSPSHFSRTIKSRYGVTPGQLRRDMGFVQSSDKDSSVEDLIFD